MKQKIQNLKNFLIKKELDAYKRKEEQEANNEKEKEQKKYQQLLEFAENLDNKGIHLLIKALLMTFQSDDLLNMTKHYQEEYSERKSPFYSDYIFLTCIQKEKYEKLGINIKNEIVEMKHTDIHFLSRPTERKELHQTFSGTTQSSVKPRDAWSQDDNHKLTLYTPWNIAIFQSGLHSGIITILNPEIIKTPIKIKNVVDYKDFLLKIAIKNGKLIEKETGKLLDDVEIHPAIQTIYELGNYL